LRSQGDWYDDPDRFTTPNANTDPAHGDKSDAPPPLMMDAPVLQDGGEIFTDAQWENYEHLPPATRIDETPVDGQGNPEATGHGYGGIFLPGASENALGAARGRDTGASRRATTTTPTYRMWHELWYGFFTKGFEPPPITTRPGGDPVLRRGINGYPDNDGESGRDGGWSVTPGASWRRGDYEGAAVERRFSPPNRTHGQFKMVEPDIVTIIGDVPPPDQHDVYSSPFSTLQTFLPKRRRVRGIRRDPGPWDEDLQAIGPVIGLSQTVDGMVVN
jgi:hypothetical protein